MFNEYGTTFHIWFYSQLRFSESLILKELGFALYYIQDHPHKYILYFVKILGGTKELAGRAWCYCNDLMRLDACVRFEASVLACACILKAACSAQTPFPLPQPADTALPWFTVLCNLESEAPLLMLGRLLEDALYSQEKVSFSRVLLVASVLCFLRVVLVTVFAIELA